MKKHPLISIFLITFLITWGIAGLYYYFAAYGVLFLIAALLISQLRPATPVVDPIPGWSWSAHESPQPAGNLLVGRKAARL